MPDYRVAGFLQTNSVQLLVLKQVLALTVLLSNKDRAPLVQALVA